MTIIDVTRFSRYLGRIVNAIIISIFICSHSSNIFHLFLCAYHMCIYHSLGLAYPYTTIPSRYVVESILIHPKLIVVYCRCIDPCRELLNGRPLLLCMQYFVVVIYKSNIYHISNAINHLIPSTIFIIVGFGAVLHNMLCRCTSTTILIVGSTYHTSIAMSMRRQTDQQTIAIISLDYHR